MLIPENLSPEEQLVFNARRGDQLAFASLLTKYAPIIRLKASRFYKGGYDAEDFFQEGTLGLYNAVMTYSRSGGASFGTYASICVEHRLISAYKNASRKKNSPLENYIPLANLDQMNSSGSFSGDSPEERVIQRENRQRAKKILLNLRSEKERSILILYLRGYSYKKISSALNIPEKSVDNSLQRIKRRLKAASAGNMD